MDCKYSNQIKTFNHLKDNKCLNSLVNNVYINVAGCLINLNSKCASFILYPILSHNKTTIYWHIYY